MDPTVFPLHFAQLFVEVARRDQCTFAELEEALGISGGSVSRSVAALSAVNRYGGKGYELLEIHKDPAQPRRYLVKLTAKGRALVRQFKDF